MSVTLQIPPNAKDLEQAVIGAMLIDSRCIGEVVDIITPEVFYLDKHRIIFQAIYEMFRDSEVIDLLTVSERLKKSKKIDEIGGDHYLIELTKRVASSAHIEFHSRIILQKYIQRELINNSRAIIEHSYRDDKDVFDLLDSAYDHLNNVSEISIKPQEQHLGALVAKQIEKGRKIYKGEIKPGLTTPIKKLTAKTGGWRDSELIIMAGRPGMGKTAFALLCGHHIAKQNIPVAFFSLEMSKEQLINRILSMEGRIDGEKFTVHGLSEDDEKTLEPVRKELEKMPFIIDDTASISIEQFQIRAKRLKSKYGIKLIIVDYLQLMSGNDKNGNREREISKISRGLKLTAKSLNIPVIALSQLSRAVETRGGSKRPVLSDLRESGAIEQDADMVMFLYRPEYYKISEWDDYKNASTEGEAEYIVAKNRNGGLVRNRMNFEAKYTLFSDLDEEQTYMNDIPKGIPSEVFEDLEDLPF